MSDFLLRFAPDHVAPGTFQDAADTMLFVHIPKTAGVSVGKTFQRAFDHFYSVQWDNVAASFRNATRQATYDQSRARKRQVIMGHYGWSELQVWRNHEMPMKCGTIFRDPVARVISNYNYNCSSAHPARETFVSKYSTLESYAAQMPFDVQLHQAVGMVASFQNALEKLTRYYTFLGITEKLSQSLRHLSTSHSLPDMTEHRENVGQRAFEKAGEDIRSIIVNRSYNDIRLHRLLTRLYNI